MPTKFRKFFTLASDADPFQTRVYNAIGEATTMMGCYGLIYRYIIDGLKWRSRQDRHDLMDARVDVRGLNQLQMEDAKLYFEEGELAEWDKRVLFEYLSVVGQDAVTYGENVFILKVKDTEKVAAQTACRQIQLYSQVQTYNEEYELKKKYCENHKLKTRPPNSIIKIDAKTARVDPDNAKQKNQLKKFVVGEDGVGGLVNWVKDNYPDVKAVLAATSVSELFNLVFNSGVLSTKQTITALETMLDKIRNLGDSNPSTKKEFGGWLIGELEKQKKFWDQEKISGDYASIQDLKEPFDANTTRNLKIYSFFMTLFADFLSPNQYEGESEAKAQQRRKDALNNISTIFSKFKSNQNTINEKYEVMMKAALLKIQQDYVKRYTSNLLNAAVVIPGNDKVKTVLPEDLATALKEKADELLRTLPLLRDNTKVSFFTVQNFEDMTAMSSASLIVQHKEKSPVIVKADPMENGEPRYRPVYRSGFRIGDAAQRAIAFGNLKNESGTFYYRHIDNPSIAMVKSTVKTKKGETRILTIDFHNYTINYPDKPNGRSKDDFGQAYRSGGSTSVFFADLKKNTKWTEIMGGRRYDPYYSTVETDATLSEPHLTAYVAAGRGAARTLPLGDDSLCLWLWNYSNTLVRANYERLGEVLGLPTSRQINPVVGGFSTLQKLNQKRKVQIGGKQCDFINYGPKQFETNGFYYSVIGITKPKKAEEFYVQVNTPGPGIAGVLSAKNSKLKSRPLDDGPKQILDLFNFSYYRRITSVPDEVTQDPLFTDDSKVIQLYGVNDKRKPSGTENKELEWPDDTFVAIAANLPICFNVEENLIRYFLDKQGRGKIINKGNSLFREQKPRKDAGTAMSPIYRKLRPPLATELSASKVPATAFAKGAVEQSPAVQDDWCVLKVASGNYLPINQEWCHLRGHGDGGDEYPGNFVSGSYHCNTEQLAIETGQRLITQQMPEHTFKLHTSAYLLKDATNYKSQVKDEQKSQILTASYLQDQTTYTAMLDNNNIRRDVEKGVKGSKVKKPIATQSPPPRIGEVAPLAAYLRYKVMKSGTATIKASGSKRLLDEGTLVKFFDFIFEGQSEFIDKNQFTIISQAVQFALAGKDALDMWYEQEKNELDSSTGKTLQQMRG